MSSVEPSIIPFPSSVYKVVFGGTEAVYAGCVDGLEKLTACSKYVVSALGEQQG